MEENALEKFVEVLIEHNQAYEAISKKLDSILENQEIIARNLNVIYDIVKVELQQPSTDEHNQLESDQNIQEAWYYRRTINHLQKH